jgi:formylglycine-generating enzyme required for sulfatase activity
MKTWFANLGLPAGILIALLGILALQTGAVRMPQFSTATGPQTVVVASRSYSYRAGGEYIRGNAYIDAPLLTVADAKPVEIMKFQVSVADYGACVVAGACERAAPRNPGAGDVPVTGVSFKDATDFASWLSQRTGDVWRLPTLAEWSFAAGSRGTDQALGLETNTGDPAQRWLALYEREAIASRGALEVPAARGSGGVNEFGVADLAGAVWEWTSTCGGRTVLDGEGTALTHLESCGIRYVEGKHRAEMNIFIRDAQGGGCSTGSPPDNLGFRLVRERR